MNPRLSLLCAAVLPAILAAQAPEVDLQIRSFQESLKELREAQGHPSEAQVRKAQAFLFATTSRLQTESSPELRQVLSLGRYLVQERAFPSVPGAQGAAAARDFWVRMRDLLDISPMLPPESPALVLVTGAEASHMKDFAWHASGGGFAQQTESQAASKAMAYLARIQERNPNAEVRKTAATHRVWFKVVDAGIKRDFKEAELALSQLEAEQPGSAQVTALREQLKGLQERKVLVVGEKVPAFRVPELDKPGTTLTPASFKGKYLLIDFWATWCAPCRKELPFLAKAYEAYHAKGLEILSVSHDKKEGEVVAWRKDAGHPMPWRHGFLQPAAREAMAKAFGVEGIPHILLVGPDGTILEVPGMNLRGENLEKTLARFMAGSR